MCNGFGNHVESEAVLDTLPVGQNSPQHVAAGLYAEQLSGSAFTAPRGQNARTWVYRTRPSASHGRFAPYIGNAACDSTNGFFAGAKVDPNRLRWDPPKMEADCDFVDALRPVACAGDPSVPRGGLAIFVYAAGKSMGPQRAFFSADGALLLVPQAGVHRVVTELGVLTVPPCAVAVIPRGIRFRVDAEPDAPPTEPTQLRGYVLEVYGAAFELPDLGPLGANGLANPQDFWHPHARFETAGADDVFHLITKTDNCLFAAQSMGTSPMNVVAWRGNYLPFAYDLRRFQAFGSTTWDHADPSIFTVLTAKSTVSGTAVADFVIFPPAWQAAEHTFRPPYFHRNVMAEFMGLVAGRYEAKPGAGFAPGGASLHPACAAHGPDADCLAAGLAEDTSRPARVRDGSLAFMFESALQLRVVPAALAAAQPDYDGAWLSIPEARL